MSTLIAAGASAAISLVSGAVLYGSGPGVAVLGPGPQSGQQYGLQGMWSIGPFPRAQIVYVSAIGLPITWDTAPLSGLAGAPVVDPSTGGLLGLATGLGSLAGPSNPSLGPALLAGFGDSIVARSVTAGSLVICYNGHGPLSWIQALSMGRLWMPLAARVNADTSITKITDYCKGVSGETTADMLLRTTDITNLRPLPAYVFVLAGTNDLTVAATKGDSVDTMFIRWMMIVSRFLAAGIRVVGCTVLPRGSMASGSSGSRPGWQTLTDAEILVARGKLLQFNDRIRAFCAATPGMKLCDPWRRLVDTATSTSDMLLTMNDSADYIHPNDLGAYNIAAECIGSLSSDLPTGDTTIFGAAGDAYSASNTFGSMIDGTFSIGTGGTATAPVTAGGGGMPTNWTFNRLTGGGSSTAVVQKQVRADGKNGWEANCVYTGGAGGPDVFRGFYSTGAYSSANFAAGDAFFMASDASVVATGAYAPPDINARLNTVNIYALKKFSADVPGTYTVRLRTPLVIQPAAPGNVNAWTLDTIGTVCSATVNRRDMSLRRYDTSFANAVPLA